MRTIENRMRLFDYMGDWARAIDDSHRMFHCKFYPISMHSGLFSFLALNRTPYTKYWFIQCEYMNKIGILKSIEMRQLLYLHHSIVMLSNPRPRTVVTYNSLMVLVSVLDNLNRLALQFFRQLCWNIWWLWFAHLHRTICCTVLIKNEINTRIYHITQLLCQNCHSFYRSLTGFQSPTCHWGHFLPTLQDFSVAGLFPAFCKHSASSSGFCSLYSKYIYVI